MTNKHWIDNADSKTRKTKDMQKDYLNFESNVKAVLECNFAGFKDEVIENACKLICDLKFNDTQKEN